MSATELFANRYRLERRLGAGGMSTVRLAFDSRLERYVAVKLLAEHLAEDPAFVSRFRREALAAARLVHPNVVQVYDFGLDEPTGRQFIVMEYVEGESCAVSLRERGRLETEEAVEILVQACRGLEYAHRNGVIHRDVKPGNLLRSRDRVVKLADFGIAKASEHSAITKVGSVLGTAAYLAPEQARGEPAGPQSDLYALGVVAYQLLTGRLPYQADSLTEIALAQERGGAPPVHDLAPDVPPTLSAAVAQALERDPARRYPGAGAMEQGLLGGLHGTAPPVPPTQTATRVLTGTGTAPTSALPRATGETQLQPATPAAPVPPGPRRRPPAPERRPARRRWPRRLVPLVLLAALGVGGVALAREAFEEGSRRAVELRRDVSGDVDRAVEELKRLIEENTR